MQKSRKLLIGAIVGVFAIGTAAAIAGPVIYRDFIAAPAAEAPTLSADKSVLGNEEPSQPTGGVLDPMTLVGTWNVTDGSEAGYRVDEVLNGTDVTVTGRTDQVTGTFTIGETGLTLEAADLTVDVASIVTDSGNRDEYFRGEAMRASKFPTATFTLTEPVTLDNAPAAGDVVSAEATGDLTLAGQTRTVSAQIEVRSDGETAEIAGSINITFADFGIDAPNLGFVQVAADGAVEFQLTAAKQ